MNFYIYKLLHPSKTTHVASLTEVDVQRKTEHVLRVMESWKLNDPHWFEYFLEDFCEETGCRRVLVIDEADVSACYVTEVSRRRGKE